MDLLDSSVDGKEACWRHEEQLKHLSPPTGQLQAGAAYLEVGGAPADLVDVGQGAAVVRTLTAGQAEVLGLELQRAGQRPPLPAVTCGYPPGWPGHTWERPAAVTGGHVFCPGQRVKAVADI